MFYLVLACGAPAPDVPAFAVPVEVVVLEVGDGDVVGVHEAVDGLPAGVHRFDWLGETPPALLDRASVKAFPSDGTWKAAQPTIVGTAAAPAGFVAGGHAVRGTVVRVDADAVVLDHEAIPGVMMAMVMPFEVVDARLLSGVAVGDRVEGRLLVANWDHYLVELETKAAGTVALREDVAPLRVLEPLRPLDVATDSGPWRIGEGHGVPTLLTFVYTRCPDPDFCPAIVMRLAALQEQVRGRARLLAITLDPDHDSLEVLREYAVLVHAEPDTWRFGRVDDATLQELALRNALDVTVENGRIVHQIRLAVLDADGRLLERYHDNRWDLDRVVSQLLTSAPTAHPASQGTISEGAP